MPNQRDKSKRLVGVWVDAALKMAFEKAAMEQGFESTSAAQEKLINDFVSDHNEKENKGKKGDSIQDSGR